MPQPSPQKKWFLAAAERATEGGRRKRAWLTDEVPQLEQQVGEVENHVEDGTVGINQPGPVTSEPPPGPNPNEGVDEDSNPNNTSTPKLDAKSPHNHPPASLEAYYAHNQVDAATQTRCWSDTGNLPYYDHGWWNVSILEDEGIVHEIKALLEKIRKLAGPKDIVELLEDPETRRHLGILKPISLRAAQQWMQCCGGFCWQKTPKGQYLDGHEQPDVVDYRQKDFLQFWHSLEPLRTIYNEHGIPDPTRPVAFQPGEKPVIIWFHDKSIFFCK